MLDSVPSCEMHIILVLWMVLIAGTAYAFEIRDVHGVLHETDGNNVIIVIGNTNCPPMDRMLMDHLLPLKRDYPDIQGIVLFPCESPSPAAIRAWADRVPNANLFCAVDYPITNLFLTNWMAMGAPQYGGWIYNRSGECVTNWSFWRSRSQLEPTLTRQLLDLKICVSNGIPCATWRQTKLVWQPEWIHNGNIHTMVLKLK